MCCTNAETMCLGREERKELESELEYDDDFLGGKGGGGGELVVSFLEDFWGRRIRRSPRIYV